ncbi:MAG: MbnP family protein [Microscillaceae bacterium]|nr:MbnP family protein [Microscillaceae bacterium]
MKTINLLLFSILALFFFTSCNEDTKPEAEFGQMVVEFDHMVGTESLKLDSAGSTNYPYITANGQPFNLSLFGYYISKIKLEGPNGEVYEDEMNVSVNAAEVKGYYHVLEGEDASQFITLKNIPAGKYNKITFTVGIEEEGIQEGVAGGVLDPAEGAWFWNWNAGYIGFAMEGTSPNSPQEEVIGSGWKIYENSFAIHVGGWKNITPAQGEVQKFVNNVKTITLDFGTTVTVSESLEPEPHIIVDVLKVLNGAQVDFSTTYSLHSPAPGQVFANQLEDAFILDHVHQ